MEIFNRKLNNIILRKSKKLNIEPEKDRYIKSYARKNNKVLLAIIEPLSGAEGDLEPDILFGVDLIFDSIDIRKTTELLFLINTSGGSGYTLALAKTIRRLFNKITVFIPGVAASAGTLLSLIGDEIVMGRMGHMSPVDSQLCIKDGNDEKYVSIRSLPSGFKKLIEELKGKKDRAKSPVYKTMLDKIDLRLKDEYERVIINDVQEIEDLLCLSNYSKAKAYKIADKLVNAYPTHDHIIDYYEALRLGLRVKHSRKYKEEWELMKYWFLKYSDRPSSKIYIRYVIP